MAQLADFLRLVRGKLPGCPEILMEEAVRESAIEFCKRTQLLADEVSITTKVGVRFYELYPPEGAAYDIDTLRRDDDDYLDPSSRHNFQLEELDVDTGEPAYYYIEGDSRLVLGPIPEAAETLYAKVTVFPEANTSLISDVLYNEWRREIAAGARAFVRENYFEWTNDQEEAKDRALFNGAVDTANVRRAKGRSKKPLRTRANFF